MNKNMLVKDCINEIGKFLAVRDIDELTSVALEKKYSLNKVKLLVLLGNSISSTIKCAVEAYNNGICEKVLICGGIGHSTEILRNTIKSHDIYKYIDLDGQSEADIFYQIINKYYNIPKDKIIIENKSTNCGENAKKAIELLDTLSIDYSSVILVQDPTMQLRTYASFLKYINTKDDILLINYAPFIPVVDDDIAFVNKEIDGIWTMDRYIQLLMGEIPRLKDDINGYGPNGKGFIEHIDIPSIIDEAYSKLENIIRIKTR
ncbi:YdcF family protein [Clostridium vincentii]|uniref:DUF218 domain-containing protein n=1 Tax=Clostridium vincentii TaxID=52704 RepID=A0A2T0BCK9_9CLOT|nr:YdcF family protein [Clostridium vincentii]PRR81636.1 hypothetical protein CLVI_23610 [Clostridium vincentii]